MKSIVNLSITPNPGIMEINRSILLFFILLLTAAPILSQNAQYDVRFRHDHNSCFSSKVRFDVEVKASSPASWFNISSQNYRFTFDRSMIDNPVMDQPLALLPSQGYFLTLNGSTDSLVSLNVIFVGVGGMLITDTALVGVGRLEFDLVVPNGYYDLAFNSFANGQFPPTVVTEWVSVSNQPLISEGTLSDFSEDWFTVCGCQLYNNQPIATDDYYSTSMDSLINGSVLLNDLDPDYGSTLAVTVPPLINAKHGLLTMNTIGYFTYLPDPGFFGRDSIQYEVCDGGYPTLPALCDTAYLIIETKINFAKFPCAKDGNEPNNSLATATHLSNGTISGFSKTLICDETDVDWFRYVQQHPGQTLNIRLRGMPTNFDMEVRGASGYLIALSDNPVMADEYVSIPNTAGTYYIKVFGHNGAWHPIYPYQLLVHSAKVSYGGTGQKPAPLTPLYKVKEPVVTVYPQPVVDELNIRIEAVHPERLALSLLDLQGRELLSDELEIDFGARVHSLNIENLSKGTYILSLAGSQGFRQSRKVLILDL